MYLKLNYSDSGVCPCGLGTTGKCMVACTYYANFILSIIGIGWPLKISN